MQGVALLTITEILGHKDLKMTRRYAHVAPTHRLAAISLLDHTYNQRLQDTNGSSLAAESNPFPPLPAPDWQQKRQQGAQTPLSILVK
jgi:hypothetical protein